jgi:hypothetical protein
MSIFAVLHRYNFVKHAQLENNFKLVAAAYIDLSIKTSRHEKCHR